MAHANDDNTISGPGVHMALYSTQCFQQKKSLEGFTVSEAHLIFERYLERQRHFKLLSLFKWKWAWPSLSSPRQYASKWVGVECWCVPSIHWLQDIRLLKPATIANGNSWESLRGIIFLEKIRLISLFGIFLQLRWWPDFPETQWHCHIFVMGRTWSVKAFIAIAQK